jgi:membrane-associated protease RseP (regulator of RpoE activity)
MGTIGGLSMKRSVIALAAALALAAPAAAQVSAGVGGGVGVGVGVRRGWFGIQLEENVIQRGPGRVAYVQRPSISWVESGSPAYQAGLRSGDTLVSINGLAFTAPEGFEAFANAVPGTAVRIVVRKAGQEREVSVTPIDNPSSTTTQDFYMQRLRTAQRLGLTALRNAFRSPLGWLGMGLECEQCSVTNFGQRMRGASFRQPPAVLTVDVDGPAHRAGLRRGDTLTTIDGVDLTSREGGQAFSAVEPGQRVTLGVRRGGAERRVMLTAVARPDATQEEIAAFDEYKRSRDSSDASYRELLAASTARAQVSIRELERALREMDNSRSAADSTRRVMGSLDSLIRVLRMLERRKYSESGFDFSFNMPNVTPRAFAMPSPAAIAPMAPTAPTTPAAAMAPMAYAGSAPLRYSGRLGAVNVEVRSFGPNNTQEVGDSLIVINTGSAEIKVYLRPNR